MKTLNKIYAFFYRKLTKNHRREMNKIYNRLHALEQAVFSKSKQEHPAWGEEATEWARQVTEALNQVTVLLKGDDEI